MKDVVQVKLVLDLIIGATVGAIEGGSVFFAREEPYKVEITLAAALKGLLTGLLIGFSLGLRDPWWKGAAFGSLYGLALALVVFLAKGGFRSKDAPYVVPAGLVSGAVIGILIALLAL